MKKIIVSNKAHYIGVNDRKKNLFENNWPLPYGVTYNSYLIADQKTALIDTLEFGSKDNYIEEIEAILQEKTLDYLVLNHMEPDHSSMIGWIIKRYPQVKIVTNSKAFKMLDAYYGIDKESIHEVKDGETLDLGYHKLKFI
ncbi:MAG: MBL fold metallo-hydrolase, partial [Bacteroidales bacterium]